MEAVYLLLGSNMGDRLLHMSKACEEISARGIIIKKTSNLYETAPWGNTAQPSFLNQIIEVNTSFPPEQLLQHCLAIEESLGRVRNEIWGPRVIDIDILYYGRQIIHLPQLQIPHKGIPERAFCLVPMVEIAPDFLHPQLQVTQAQLLAKCPDQLPVTLFEIHPQL